MAGSGRRFRVALSFPGEKRDFVRGVAEALSAAVGKERVLYDKYLMEELVRLNLDLYLGDLYNNSDLIVPFFCADYERKEWCGLEWRNIRDIGFRGGSARIMPFRFDDAAIPGLLSIDNGYKIGDSTPEAVANLILARLDVKPETPLDSLRFDSPVFGLPADLPDFVGRSAELEQLLTAARGAWETAVVAIQGMGGIGKSALAVHAAHQLAENARDGRLYIDLEGASERPLGAIEVMGRVIAAFEPRTEMPAGATNVIHAYQRVLAERHVLLILDNARDAVSVAPVIQHRRQHCRIIITSREPIALPGVMQVRLEDLTPDEAKHLLREIIGPQRGVDDMLAKLARRCAYLPLALRAAGTNLLRYPKRTIERYLSHLDDGMRGLEKLRVEGFPNLDVISVLWSSFRDLQDFDQQLAEHWRQLVIFPSDFDRAAAAAVWALPEKAAWEALDELEARNMVIFDAAESRYRLHDLMREVAMLRHTGEDEAAVSQRMDRAALRHARHYVELMIHIFEDPMDFIAAAVARQRENRNLKTGTAWLVERLAASEDAAQLAAQFASARAYLFDSFERKTLMQQLETTRKAGNRRAEGHVLAVIARDFQLNSRHEAIAYDEQRLAIAREIGDRHMEYDALCHLAGVCLDMEDFQKAVAYYEPGLTLSRALNDRSGEAHLLGGLGAACNGLGQTRLALQYQEQRLAIARSLGDRREESDALAEAGDACFALGETQRAFQFYQQCFTPARGLGSRRIEAKALRGMGRVCVALDEPRRAIPYLKRRLKISYEIHTYDEAGEALGDLALAWTAIGELRRAIACYKQQLETARRSSDWWSEGNALFNLALLHDRLGQRPKAIPLADEAFGIFMALGCNNDSDSARAKEHEETIRAKLLEWGVSPE